MSEIRPGLEEVPAVSRRRPAPSMDPGPVMDDIAVLQASLNDARKATWQGDLGVAQEGVERVLQGLSAHKQGGAVQAEDIQAMEGSAESLLGQIMAEREGLGSAHTTLQRAADVLRLIAGREPRSALTYADYGAALYLLGQRQEAERALRRAVELGDASPPTARRLASLLLDAHRAEEARQVLLPANTGDPGDLGVLSLLARAERELGDHDAALTHLKEAAAAAFKAGKLDRALELYEDAAELSADAQLALARAEVLRALGSMERAVEAYDAALAVDPGLLQAKVGKADALRVLGCFDPALDLLQHDVLRTEPRHATALTIAGDILRNQGRYAEALGVLDASLAEEPASAWTIGTRGQVLRALGRHADALADLERATADAPELAWAWAELAATHYELGNAAQARPAAERALELDPDIPLALAVRARCLVDAGAGVEALDTLRALLETEPAVDWVWTDLALALRESGDEDSARDVVERAIASGRGGAAAFLLRAELRLAAGGQDGKPAAREDLDTFLRSEPADSASLLRAGRAYRAAGDPQNAAKALEQALAAEDTPEIRCEKAAAEFDLEHYEKVLEAIEKVASPPAGPEDLWRCGVAAWRLGNTPLANRSFKRALEQQPGYLPALRQLVFLNIGLQKLDRAYEYARIALEEHPRDSDALSAAAILELTSLDYDAAFDHLDEALRADARNRTALYAYGRGLAETGRFRRAVDISERLRAAGGDSEAAFEMLGFSLENAAIGMLPSTAASLTDEVRGLLVRAQRAYDDGLRQHEDSLYLKRDRADAMSVLEGLGAANAAYAELITALEAAPDFDRDLIGLLGWCYFRLGRYHEAIRAYVSALAAETEVGGDYLRFDLALATLASDQADHGRAEYRHARESCETVPIPKRRGLFQVARNDLVETIIAGGFRDPAVAVEIAADFDRGLEELVQQDTSRPRDPFDGQ